jgi:hypothetical protein
MKKNISVNEKTGRDRSPLTTIKINYENMM